MGTKLSWTGLALVLVSPILGKGNLELGLVVAGAIILTIGIILQWLDK